MVGFRHTGRDVFTATGKLILIEWQMGAMEWQKDAISG
jgi:hypothetical protein